MFPFLRRVLLRSVALLAVVTIIPSCGDDGDGGSGPADLFIDDFDAGLGAWTIVNPSVTINPTGELRPPTMRIASQAGVAGEARTTATFGTAGGLTISVDVFPGSSIAEIAVVDVLNPTVIDTYAIISDNSVHYSVQGQTLKIDFPPDPYPHKFLFHIEAGMGTWQRDGKTHKKGAFSAANVFLDCRDLDTGSLFDLVHVTTP